MPKLPTNIAEVRQRYGWTQQRLAEYLEVDTATVSRWERGLTRPRRGVRAAIERLRTGTPTEAANDSADPSINELVRILGTEPARRALRRLVLQKQKPAQVEFPVDPSARLHELETLLREQSELIARARIH